MSETTKPSTPRDLRDVLREEKIQQIVRKSIGDAEWELLGTEVRPASDSIMGYLGHHWRSAVHLKVGGEKKTMHIFIKSMPVEHESLVQFLKESKTYLKEMVVLKIFDEIEATQGTNTFCPKMLLYNETLVVMSDISVEGYVMRPQVEAFDLPHLLATVASLAHFHAAIANYETRKSIAKKQPYNVLQDYGDVIVESNFQDSPWLRAGAKNAYKFIITYFATFKEKSGLEESLLDFFIKTCEALKQYDETLNVLIHKDLWVNNIMFKYENNVPVHAIILDYQCARYAPPGFDVMFTLYLNSTRQLREQHEKQVLQHYYDTFWEALDSATKERLIKLNYDFGEFLSWCERGRRFGVALSMCVLPYTMIDGAYARTFLQDREVFLAYISADLTDHKLQYSRECVPYRNRVIDLYTEFIERYVSALN